MEQRRTTHRNYTGTLKTALTIALICLWHSGYSTAWTTVAAGPANTLSNWTDGAASPSSFTTPGDTWTIAHAMTLPGSAVWNIGTAASAPATLTFATGGTLSMTGAGSTSSINVYGNMVMSGGTLTLGGAGTTETVTVYGDLNMSAGSIATSGSTSLLYINVRGNYNMTGGTTTAGGAGAGITLNIYGNGSFSGTAAMTSTGAGTNSVAHFRLPSSSGTMLISNTSTGTWSKTNVYIDTNCTAQLAGNFSTTTGTAAFGLVVDGTLICPAAYVINGTRSFTLNGVATLKVAHATGINGAITTTGTTTFNTSANYEFNGTAAQVTGTYLPAALVSPSVLTINNIAGVTLSQPTATTGILAFLAGILHTAAHTMTTPGAATSVSGAGASSYVDGQLIKTISGHTSINYEVGNTSYAPMRLALAPAGTGGSLGLRVTPGLHPSVASSGLSATAMANHYWTISSFAATGPTTVTPTATYNSADIIGGTNASFLTQQYVGAAWLPAALASTNTSTPYTSTPTTGIALASLAGQYIFGALPCGTLPITGTPTVCAGATTALADATPGGTWNSGTPAVATVSATGLVTGIAAGTATISYTAGGCTVTLVVTVLAAPAAGTISGVTSGCIGGTTTLTATVAGGTWSSSIPAAGTVSAAGVVGGVSAGTTVISYTVTNACGSASATVTVSIGTTLTVAPILGPDSVCVGNTITLTSATGGGVWSSFNTALATVSATGVVTGVATGIDTIYYTITNSCGTAKAKKTVKVAPAGTCPTTGQPAPAYTQAAAGLHIAPNPNNGSFTIQLPATNAEAQISIADITGRIVQRFLLAAGSSKEVSLHQPPGIYIISATTPAESFYSKIRVE